MNGIKQEPMDEEIDVPKLNQYPKQYTNRRIEDKPESLLKPINQRPKIEGKPLPPLTPIEIATEVQPALIKSRFNLKLALSKAAAKDESNIIKPKTELIRINTDSPETVTYVPSPKSITTVSSTSNSSSEEMDVLKDEQIPEQLDKEKFLGMFGLFTPVYCHYLQNRRPQRKRRSCTSAERREYHCGKYELYERQFSKRGKKQFLYSPPATRAKRRIASNPEKTATVVPEKKDPVIMPKRSRATGSNHSSSSSLSSQMDTQYVCLTCFGRSMFYSLSSHIANHS